MNVSLTPELEKLVHRKVSTGMYHSASEVIREALRLMKERDRLRRGRLDELRAAIAVGVEQADSGRTHPFDAARLKHRLRRKLARQKQPRHG